MAKATIYIRAVEISEEYLGPAGERFLRRQIDTHLGIKPELLNTKHLPKLIKWTELAFSLLTSDRFEVVSFTKNLRSLGSSKPVANEKTH